MILYTITGTFGSERTLAQDEVDSLRSAVSTIITDQSDDYEILAVAISTVPTMPAWTKRNHMRGIRNWVGMLLASLGMVISQLGDRIYAGCEPDAYFAPGHIDHECVYKEDK